MASQLTNEHLIWLHSNYVQCDCSTILQRDILGKYIQKFGTCKPQQFSSMVRRAFPQIISKRERSRHHACVNYLLGLAEVNLEESNKIVDFESFAVLIPPGYFITSRSETSYELAKYTGLVCNGCKVTLEIKITSHGDCETSVMDTFIDTGFSAVELTFNSIRVFFAVLESLRFCQGIACENEDLSNQENVIVQFSEDGSKVVYSTKCRKALPFTQLLSNTVCVPCKRRKKEAYKEQSRTSCKVAVLGASGVIGQPLSLLLKQSPLISELALYDLAHTLGVAADLRHIDTHPKVSGHWGLRFTELKFCLTEADIVIITAGVPGKPGMAADYLFKVNASIVEDLCEACTRTCPEAMILIVTNPVNSMVPIASEVFMKHDVYDPDRIFGVTTLDVLRSNTFIAESQDLDASKVNVPVIGGHSGVTIIPLISQSTPQLSLSEEEIDVLTRRIQKAGQDVETGAGPAPLSIAYAAARFTFSLIEAIGGAKEKIECVFVRSDETVAKYFANPIELGKTGVKSNLGLGELTEYERNLLREAIPELLSNITKGEDFIKNSETVSQD